MPPFRIYLLSLPLDEIGDWTAAEGHQHLRRNMTKPPAAVTSRPPISGTFIGREPGLSVVANPHEGEKTLPHRVAYATDHGVEIVVENRAMEGGLPYGHPGNLAHSPEP